MSAEYAEDSGERGQKNSPIKSALTFILHQLVATCGIPFTAPIVFSLAFKVLLLFGRNYPSRNFYKVVGETPYFPVQIVFAIILGWLLGRSLRHRSMLWVWVLPSAILCYALIKGSVLVPEWTSVLAQAGVNQSRFSHFFGWGCRTANHCLDQLVITMPFYSSLAYSIGALVAERTARPGNGPSRKLYLAVMSAGLIIILAVVVDLIISIQQSGWHKAYWLILATPGGLGVYLLHVASTVRRQHSRSASA